MVIDCIVRLNYRAICVGKGVWHGRNKKGILNLLSFAEGF